MTEWRTLRVTESAYRKAKDQKEEHGRTWSQQLVAEETVEVVEVDDIVDRIDTPGFGGAISDEKAKEILGKLDDLRAELPRETAKEVQG